MRISSEGTETVVLAVAGEVDLGTAPSLEEAVTTAVSTAGAHAVRIDLTEVSFMDSTGLRVLLTGRQAAEQRGIAFTVANPQPHLLKVMRVTGIDGLLGLS
ncbi:MULTISPECIES: STAS domain-containing protein [unclassified Kutzneria]|uniref:STAS domain-containing protein n=1 Tax=unclassified Kutzneria TaxID=2621979 RepID=UPI0003EEC4A0|nr:STAS domain-containing protein [Kutzneria sp. 744]EWM17859.1 STAS domain-containing protein [Kutzneria sp. 744]